jgi:hypothetical protein
MLEVEEKNSNIKKEFDDKEEKEISKSIINFNSNNSQEISNGSKSKETPEKTEEKKNDSINLFKKTSSSKNNSSQKLNQRYNTNENEIKEEKKNNENNDNQDIEFKPKFMQINPHFNIFSKQIDSLRDSIYDDTKRCLILKGSLQQSSNYLKEESNNLIKDIVEQIYNLRELFEKGNKGLNQTTLEVQEGLKKLKSTQSLARKEIINCDKRISECEDQIGYKLLGNPNYSFMKNIKDRKVFTQK